MDCLPSLLDSLLALMGRLLAALRASQGIPKGFHEDENEAASIGSASCAAPSEIDGTDSIPFEIDGPGSSETSIGTHEPGLVSMATGIDASSTADTISSSELGGSIGEDSDSTSKHVSTILQTPDIQVLPRKRLRLTTLRSDTLSATSGLRGGVLNVVLSASVI